jgi:hypothetical protein
VAVVAAAVVAVVAGAAVVVAVAAVAIVTEPIRSALRLPRLA